VPTIDGGGACDWVLSRFVRGRSAGGRLSDAADSNRGGLRSRRGCRRHSAGCCEPHEPKCRQQLVVENRPGAARALAPNTSPRAKDATRC